MKINVFWFRRDIRLHDNNGLMQALNDGLPVLPVFIFDPQIIDELNKGDARISFIYECLSDINTKLRKIGSSLLIIKDKPLNALEIISKSYTINIIYANEDYEPYAILRDKTISKNFKKKGIGLKLFKDQVVFRPGEVLKQDDSPYTVFTAYKNKFLHGFDKARDCVYYNSESLLGNFVKENNRFPNIEEIGFKKSAVEIIKPKPENIDEYHNYRDFPAIDYGTYYGLYLRFGIYSIREISLKAYEKNSVYFSELIWREFFMQILYFYPHVVTESFRKKYDKIEWRNDENEFEKWCNGETGYPFVDAGMKQLNNTGYMHNRVRMICASFLVKHLLIDWRRGEAYFAQKLLDYELSSNNGNWQWAAGTGCDAAPYFRVFNPLIQQQKFDPKFEYVKKFITDFKPDTYIKPIVEHPFARKRAIERYKRLF
jgi:deoxyribodipyrimidine photo-lyase